MTKARKKNKEPEREPKPKAEGSGPFPTAVSPSGIYPMTPPVWPDPGLGFDLGGMEAREGREREI